MQRGWNGEMRQRTDHDVVIPRVAEQPGLQHHLGEFLDKQGNSIGLANDCFENFRWYFLPASEISDHRGGFVAPKSIDLDHCHVRLIEPWWKKLGPEGDQQEHRSRPDRLDKTIRCFQRGRIDPMCVLDYEENRLSAGKGQNLTGQSFDREIFLPSRRQVQGRIASVRWNRQQGRIERGVNHYL